MNLEGPSGLSVALPFVESAYYTGPQIMPNQSSAIRQALTDRLRHRHERVNRTGPWHRIRSRSVTDTVYSGVETVATHTDNADDWPNGTRQ